MAPYFRDAVHSLSDHDRVRDVRSIGMMAGVELHPEHGRPNLGNEAQVDLFWRGCHVKFTGPTAIFAPMFISEREHIDEAVGKFRETLDAL